MKKLLQKIFAGKDIPPGLGKEEFQKFMDQSVHEFEEGGYLAANALTPIYGGEEAFIDALDASEADVVLVKYWKRRCLPCLSFAEMYKEAEGYFVQERVESAKAANAAGANIPLPAPGALYPPIPEGTGWSTNKPFVRFYSVNTKEAPNKILCANQLIEGTPTVQAFHCGKQMGGEIQATSLVDFLKEVEMLRSQLPTKCPN